MSLQSQLREIEREIGQNHTRLGALLQRRHSNSHSCRDESSGDGEIFSTPPSSPQPVTNLPVQSQASIDRSRLKGLESDVARLQLALDDSVAASKESAKQFKADLSAGNLKTNSSSSSALPLKPRWRRLRKPIPIRYSCH
ncbi:Oidioi.mRNA.OKI2018_I69.chr2.g6756.t5.cds [Oikopleura dioica]|uniref:Oidioi.mRNA.OKI2018_I69.chr2.g6756.t5.cds n=1 Tax=Oikopleura dioica TaxID=34765 RepID=A0ABN7TD96_OIKDI|nr:Oidioi.mRNA.OKI2018_I69.chr2.g6756.t5.cds [Oikopleura dioica]